MVHTRHPQRWLRTLDTSAGDDGLDLQGWLEEVYFDMSKHPELSREDISKVGALIRKLLQFDPANRISAAEVLQDEWIQASSREI